MKTAMQLLEMLLEAVKPAQGVAISLIERKPLELGEANWRAAIDPAPLHVTSKFDSASAELLRHHPTIDWSGIATRIGDRRRLTNWYAARK